MPLPYWHNTANASATDGTIVNASQIMIQGGSNATAQWQSPKISNYKLWVKVPAGSSATTATYQVYLKGNAVGNSTCSSTDATYPCVAVTLNHAVNQNKWVQLINGDGKTPWQLRMGAFVSINAATISSSEQLGISSLSFEDANPLAIGQIYKGGIIFYLDKTKKHGLVAAPKDILNSSGNPASVTWYNGSYSVTGATGTKIGTGQANTTAIIANQGSGSYAAKLADDLVVGKYSDWYLPSKDELNLMYTNIGQGAPAPLTNIGGFVSIYYWSSSEYDYSLSWYQSFDVGYQNYNLKSNPLLVRAVRAF
ncbi:MAG: DUF1566 domain-containing protein [Methylococcaceae bacterium]